MNQNLSFLTQLGIIFKKLTGIEDISAFRKEIKKTIGRNLYHKKYDADDIIKTMKSLGMKKGSVVCIHAAMKEFYNYRGSAQELIDKLKSFLTEEGTIIMPAYPERTKIFDKNFIFDAKNTPTAAGYLAETFRTSEGVIRSINTQHSACAWGKYAKWLLEDHNKCTNCWDENSPWYRMTQIKALVFSVGLSNNYIGTFDHCVEGLLYKEHPYWAQFFNTIFTFKYKASTGTIESYTCKAGRLECRTHENRLIKHFGQHARKKRLSNLLIKVFDSKECLDIMLDLGRKGITMYYVPSPKKYKF